MRIAEQASSAPSGAAAAAMEWPKWRKGRLQFADGQRGEGQAGGQMNWG